MSSTIKLIIVEDDHDLRECMVEYLNLAGHDAYGVGSCLEFYGAMATATFSVAVVDVGLPDQSGFVLAEYIRNNTDMGIIILTARDSLEDRIQGYGSGADIYLVKPVDCRELAAAISNLSQRLCDADAAPHRLIVADRWNLTRQTWQLIPPQNTPILLTGREMQFLECLATSPGKPVRREVILTSIGYSDDEYANRAMDSLVRRLRRKIEEQTCQPAPIKTAHAIGYCFSALIEVM